MDHRYPAAGLFNSGSVLTATGVLGTAATGIICIKEGWDSLEHSRKFVYSEPEEFRSTFETTKIDQNNTNNPFGLTAGDCFGKFFPGARHAKPSSFNANFNSSHNPHKNLINPPNFSSNPLACRVMKMSSTTQQQDSTYFVYKSETIIKADNRGLALSVAASNLKEAGKVSYEVWLLQLNKKSSRWEVDQTISHGWTGSHDRASTNPFMTKPPNIAGHTTWKVEGLATALPTNPRTDWGNEKWTPTSVWQTFTDSGEYATSELFGHETFEGRVLKDYYGATDGSRFVDAIKLTKPGVWSYFVDFCSNIKDQSEFTTPYNSGNEYACYVF